MDTAVGYGFEPLGEKQTHVARSGTNCSRSVTKKNVLYPLLALLLARPPLRANLHSRVRKNKGVFLPAAAVAGTTAASREPPQPRARVPRRRRREQLPVLGGQHRQDGSARRAVRRPDALDLLAAAFPDREEEDVSPGGESQHLGVLAAEGGGRVLGVHGVLGGVVLHLAGVLVQVVPDGGVPERPVFVWRAEKKNKTGFHVGMDGGGSNGRLVCLERERVVGRGGDVGFVREKLAERASTLLSERRV